MVTALYPNECSVFYYSHYNSFNICMWGWFRGTDYLVDEGAECNSTSDLLLERSREQSLVDLLIPSLMLLTTLLQKLQVNGTFFPSSFFLKMLPVCICFFFYYLDN